MRLYNTEHGEHMASYRDRIFNVIRNAVEEHPRTLALRVDLHDPAILDSGDTISCFANYSPGVIARFINSLNAKLIAYQQRQRSNGIRVYSNTLRYAWAREYTKTGKRHYHVLLLLNKDAFYHLGDFDLERVTLNTMITSAWSSALSISPEEGQQLIHYADDGKYRHVLNKLEIDLGIYPTDLLNRIDYMAKVKSKSSYDGSRNFGCSNT